MLLVKHDGHALATNISFALTASRDMQNRFERTIFFTDRSLYRPGQTIRFKGICVSVDQKGDNTRPWKGNKLRSCSRIRIGR